MTIQSGDRVLLFEPATSKRWLIRLDGCGARKERGLGVFDPDRLAGSAWGDGIKLAGKDVLLLRPTPADLHGTVRRKAQIITGKDMARILWHLSLGPGDRVLESGIGSGAATIGLAHAIGPTGRVVVQELRDDFATWASENVSAAGLGDRIEVHLGDLTDAVAPGVAGPFDACLLDQPQPWLAVAHVVPLLAPGARFVAYCPQVSQMEQTVHGLREAGFSGIQAIEAIERAWEVKELGSRPSFDGLGHTAFLVLARWPGPMAGATTDP